MVINPKILIEAVRSLMYSPYIHILVVLIFMDIVIGTAKAFILKKGDSSVGLKGLIKHSLVLLLLFFVNVYLPIFNYRYVARGLDIFFITQYLISVCENWGALGLPMPTVIRKSLVRLDDEVDRRFTDILKDRKNNKRAGD